MRPKFLLCVAALLLIFFVILFLWQSKQHKTTLESPLKANLSLTNIQVVATKPNNTPNTGFLLRTNQQPVNDREKTNIIRQYIESKNVPIEFYGQTIDQDGNPLSGVEIKAKVRHWVVIVPTAWETDAQEIPVERKTDSGGHFEINNATGDGFDLESIYKDGYEAEPGLRTFDAAGGSLKNPVIFKMWGTNIHKHLITGEKKFQIIPDGRSYFIDLTEGAISESGAGDLKIWVKRPSQIIYGNRYDWSCEMDAVNGGLQESDSYSMYSAPDNGYEQSFQYEQKVGSGWGDSTGSKRFYIKLHNGQIYGHFSIEIYAYYNDQIPSMIRLQYAINPSGSRILR